MHAVAPSASWKRPAAQSEQSRRPVVDAKLPGLHGLHVALLFAPDLELYIPSPHSSQSDAELLPVFELKRPAGHGVKVRARDPAQAFGQ